MGRNCDARRIAGPWRPRQVIRCEYRCLMPLFNAAERMTFMDASQSDDPAWRCWHRTGVRFIEIYRSQRAADGEQQDHRGEE